MLDVGYEISRKPRYVLRMPTGTIIGAWNCITGSKVLFQYKCTSDIHGFMLRNRIWKQLLEDYPEISKPLNDVLK